MVSASDESSCLLTVRSGLFFGICFFRHMPFFCEVEK